MTLLSALTNRYSPRHEPLRTERRIELLALLVLFLIGVQLLFLAVGSLFESRIDPVMPAPDSLRIADAAATTLVESEDTRDLLARPLFWLSRRPVHDTDIAAASEEVQTSRSSAPRLRQLKVTGVFGAGAEGGAIVNYRGDLRRVRVGDEIDGWTLDSVSATAVSFVSAGVVDSRDLLPTSLSDIEGTAPGSTAAQQGDSSVRDGASGAEDGAENSPASRPAPSSIARPASSSIARPVTRGRSTNEQSAGQEQEDQRR